MATDPKLNPHARIRVKWSGLDLQQALLLDGWVTARNVHRAHNQGSALAQLMSGASGATPWHSHLAGEQ